MSRKSWGWGFCPFSDSCHIASCCDKRANAGMHADRPYPLQLAPFKKCSNMELHLETSLDYVLSSGDKRSHLQAFAAHLLCKRMQELGSCLPGNRSLKKWSGEGANLWTTLALPRGNETIYLHRSGPLLENGLDRPENHYGRYSFPSFYSISISTVGVDGARGCL